MLLIKVISKLCSGTINFIAEYFVCVRAFVRACVRACVRARMRASVGRACVRACVRAYVRTCVRAYVRTCVRARVRACVCKCSPRRADASKASTSTQLECPM